MVQMIRSNRKKSKGQFFIISAVVMIAFIIFIYLSMSQYFTPSSTFFTTNDVYTMQNLMIEYNHLANYGLSENITAFTDYLNPNLDEIGYELNESHVQLSISGELVTLIEYEGAVGKSARDVTSNGTVYNEEEQAISVDIYWNVCKYTLGSNAFSESECGVNISAQSSYLSELFLNNIPDDWDLLIFVAKINQTEKFRLCTPLPQLEGVQLNVSDTTALQLNLSSEASILSSGVLQIEAVSCNIFCDQEDVTSCES